MRLTRDRFQAVVCVKATKQLGGGGVTLAKNKCRSLKLAIQTILKCVQYIQQKMKHTSQVPVLPYLDQELCTSISHIYTHQMCAHYWIKMKERVRGRMIRCPSRDIIRSTLVPASW